MTLSCSDSTSVGKSAVGSNLLTSQTSISATSGKFGCKIEICKREISHTKVSNLSEVFKRYKPGIPKGSHHFSQTSQVLERHCHLDLASVESTPLLVLFFPKECEEKVRMRFRDL